MAQPPQNPKLYHILHVDKLPQVIRDGCLFCDETMRSRPLSGTTIGLDEIKSRRRRNILASCGDLAVGSCVPFYFCPRSVMLYVLFRRNMFGLAYTGGQRPIIHLEFDLYEVVAWCGQSGLRWAFTLGNAGAAYYEDRNRIEHLEDINWEAIRAQDWRDPDIKEGKQAEFLVEKQVDFGLVTKIGVIDGGIAARVYEAIASGPHRPPVRVQQDWYY